MNEIVWPSWLTDELGQPTPAFRSYWHFIRERHRIYLARLAGKAAPWTGDAVLGRYRFKNTSVRQPVRIRAAGRQ